MEGKVCFVYSFCWYVFDPSYVHYAQVHFLHYMGFPKTFYCYVHFIVMQPLHNNTFWDFMTLYTSSSKINFTLLLQTNLTGNTLLLPLVGLTKTILL